MSNTSSPTQTHLSPPPIPAPLVLGRPCFGDAHLASIAAAQGDAAAWHAAVSGRSSTDAANAAALTTGAFAVGITDPQGRVFLAVDRFAVQALCWRLIDGRLHYAERADTLAALHPRVDIDPQAIYDYLYFHVIPSPRTIFAGVHRLAPAHCLWFENGQVALQPAPGLLELGKGDDFLKLGK